MISPLFWLTLVSFFYSKLCEVSFFVNSEQMYCNDNDNNNN